ncbi:hypothetical protein SO802_000117 [Lithocarpus litseifolius]|uniref:Disease resistance protein At4g27190-like leucine-rich repeats domain-containing protein n=1 Tax=Lithocarpus litseifolius TaxID=425828 RepID=A0AAW2DU35_9ROSI
MLTAATSAAASAAAGEACKGGRELVSEVKRNVDYANDLESNFKLLMEKEEKLYARKESIIAEANKHKTKQFTREWEVWISSVMKSKEEVQELKTKYDKEKSKNSKLKLFRSSSRAKLSKRMVEKCEKLHSLWLEGNCVRVLVEKLPERVRTMNAPKIEDKPSLYGLSLLEELTIDMDPNNQRWEAVVEGIIKGVATLTCLTLLSICFPNVNFLEYFISTSPSWNVGHFRFQFFVGCHDSNSYKMFDHSELQRYFKFVNGEGVNTSISKVLEETDVFELIGHKGASNLSDFGIESINKMRVCLIEGCDEIETIVDGNTVGINALKWLEMMRINNVSKLESIWEGPIHAGSLSRLSTLTLWRCVKLKKIFSNDMIEQLFELEHLSVEECHEIEEIITKSENRGLEPEVLPKLKTLVLSDLPKVKSICTEASLKWLSLKKIKISMCQLLKSLPFNNENATNLRCIEAHQSWWSELEWKEDTIKQRLQSICIFN